MGVPHRAAQRRLRPQLATDLAFYFGQHMLWLGVELAILVSSQAGSRTSRRRAGATRASQPWPVQAIEIVVIGDIVTYWYHRASHSISWLWTFHRVHHSSLTSTGSRRIASTPSTARSRRSR